MNDTTSDRTNRRPIALHNRIINGISVSDLFRRFTADAIR